MELIFEIYKEIFRRMEELYFSDREKYDSFGIILGQMSPDTFSDSYSADPAWFSEFRGKMQEIENPNLQDGYYVIREMLGKYNHEPYNMNFIKAYNKIWDTHKIVGKKEKFALEYKLNGYFDDYWVGFGKMNLYINGFCYGKKSPESWFCCVDYTFKEFLDGKPMYPNFFRKYPDKEIAKRYFRCFYTFEKPRKNYLGLKKDDFKKCCLEFSGSAEAHFDDGTFVLLFCDEKTVKLIAFQILGHHCKKIRNCNSVELPRSEFEQILQESRDFFLTERKNHTL